MPRPCSGNDVARLWTSLALDIFTFDLLRGLYAKLEVSFCGIEGQNSKR